MKLAPPFAAIDTATSRPTATAIANAREPRLEETRVLGRFLCANLRKADLRRTRRSVTPPGRPQVSRSSRLLAGMTSRRLHPSAPRVAARARLGLATAPRLPHRNDHDRARLLLGRRL